MVAIRAQAVHYVKCPGRALERPTGILVSRKTQAPLSLAGTLSTAGHCDQSRFAMMYAPSLRKALREGPAVVRATGRQIGCRAAPPDLANDARTGTGLDNSYSRRWKALSREHQSFSMH